jgi:hypothetical protein
VSQADLYPGVPSRLLLRARCCSYRSCTPGSQSLPYVADGLTRGPPETPASPGMHVRPILVDPCAYLIRSADGPVTRDEDIDVAGHALEQRSAAR